jgi:hypothetical protein
MFYADAKPVSVHNYFESKAVKLFAVWSAAVVLLWFTAVG